MPKNNTAFTDGRERRKHFRLNFKCNSTLESDNSDWSCIVRDISISGAKIFRPENWEGEIDEVFRLVITPEGLHPISMSVKVRYINYEFIGFEWNQIDLDSYNTLKRIIDLNEDKNQNSVA